MLALNLNMQRCFMNPKWWVSENPSSMKWNGSFFLFDSIRMQAH